MDSLQCSFFNRSNANELMRIYVVRLKPTWLPSHKTFVLRPRTQKSPEHLFIEYDYLIGCFTSTHETRTRKINDRNV